MGSRMTPEMTAGVFTLAGAAVGFFAAVATEFVRSRSASSREQADRRQRFQVDTLTRIQEVAKRLYGHHGTDKAAFYRTTAMPARASSLALDVDHRQCQIDDMNEMVMLAHRAHESRIQEIALSLVSATAILETTPPDEAERRIELARLSYYALQEVTGVEMLRILGYERTFASDPSPEKGLSDAEAQDWIESHYDFGPARARRRAQDKDPELPLDM